MGARGWVARRGTAAVAAAVALLGLLTVGAAGTTASAADGELSPPNIVVILTDDMRTDHWDAMPRTQQLLIDHGTLFRNAIVPTSICCPARAGFLTGTYSHTNNVWSNEPPTGGWASFQPHENQTLATALDAVGYRTGLFGKYLNGWSRQPEPQVPAGWDAFRAMRGPNGGAASYYNYTLLGTDDPEPHAKAVDDYSTDVTAADTVEFIAETPIDQPLFAVFAPYAPHTPFTSAPRHKGVWPRETLPAAANETDVTDKPPFLQALPLQDPKVLYRTARKQHQSLLAVDEAVEQIYAALGPERQANTLLIVVSDNGLMNGDHRLTGKYVPHANATEVPLAMRWDAAIAAGATSDAVVTIQDVTATIVAAAGADLPTEGVNYLESARTGSVVEGIEVTRGTFVRPAYCGWRTSQYLYVRYSNGAGEELYDYHVDPDELENAIARPEYSAIADELRLQALAVCTPGPPGFLWDPVEPEPVP